MLLAISTREIVFDSMALVTSRWSVSHLSVSLQDVVWVRKRLLAVSSLNLRNDTVRRTGFTDDVASWQCKQA